MSYPDDLTFEWVERSNGKTTSGTYTDFRVTRGTARYRLAWWKRWLMPWTHWRFHRSPSVPFPEDSAA